jgi:hypothetical protein
MVSAWWRLGAGQVTPGQHAASLVDVDGFFQSSCVGWRRSARTGPPRGRSGCRRCGCRGGSLSSRPVPCPRTASVCSRTEMLGVTPAPTGPGPPRTRRGNRSLAARCERRPGVGTALARRHQTSPAPTPRVRHPGCMNPATGPDRQQATTSSAFYWARPHFAALTVRGRGPGYRVRHRPAGGGWLFQADRLADAGCLWWRVEATMP